MKIPTADTNRFYMLAKDKAREAIKCERVSRQLADLGLHVSSKEIYAHADQCWKEAVDAIQHVVWEEL